MFFEIERSEVEYDDNLAISLVGFTEQVQEFFSVSESGRESVTRGFFLGGEFIVHHSMDLKRISRSVFNFWNVLGEIGGLYGVLHGAFAVVVSIAAFNMADGSMA